MIEDVVNLASRIEKMNKTFGLELLVSEVVRNMVSSDRLRDAIPMGHVDIRGREASIEVYQLA